MAKKPTYQELEKKIQELEQAESERKHAEDELQKRETTIKSVLDATPVGICIMKNRVYQRVNRDWCESFGYPEKNLIGRTTEFLYESNEEYERVGKELYKSLHKNGIAFARTSLKRSDGEFRDVNLIAKPLDPYDIEAGTVVVIHDITKGKQTEEILRKSEFFLRETQRVARLGGWKLNPETDFLAWTEGVYDIIEAPYDYKPGLKEGLKYYVPEYLPALQELIQRCYTHGDPFAEECELITDSGNRLWTEVRGVARVVEGKTVYVYGTFQDITDRKLAEEALQESEKKYRILIESMKDVIVRLSPTGYLTYVSPNIKEFGGYNSEDEIGNHMSKYFANKTDIIQATELIADVLETPYSGMFEFEFKPKDKEPFPVELTFTPILGKDGEVKEIQVALRDITERKRAQEALKESEKKYRRIYDNIIDAYYEATIDGIILEISPSIEKHSKYNRKELIGKSLYDVYTNPEERNKLIEVLINDGSVNEYELNLTDKDDTQRICSINAMLIKDKNGNPTKIVGILRDISDRKKAEKEKMGLEEKLVRSKKMESLGLLAGGVAHDLNNVLSGIVSYPELILMDLPEDSKFRKPIETMQESGHRAAAIVQDLLTVARGVATTKEPLNLNDLVGDYLHSPEFNKLKQFHPTVTVKTNLDTNILKISGSHVHIRKVVMNLVSNASEAIEGSGNVTISTTNRYVDRPLKGYDDVNIGEYVVLSVSDDGQGISSDDLERIFEPFYTKKVMGRSGTGLGLAVVWNTVQDHKGYLDVTSDENGTTFELYFPITRDEISDKALSIPIKNYKGNQETILVVDDEESQREISCKMLDTLGYKTKAVSSGEEAIEYLKENTVDLLLLDMIMDPGINGRETYERIIKIHPKQKTVIVSGFAETDKVKEAQKLGAGQYIKKPVTLEKIGLAVKEELEK